MARFHYWLIFMILLVTVSNHAIVGQATACNDECSGGKCISRSNTAVCNTNCRCNTNDDCGLPCCPPVLRQGQPPCCDCGFRG